MDALFIMLRNVILFVALAIPGWILIKAKILTEAQSGALSKLLMYVGMPFLILSSTMSSITFSASTVTLILVSAVVGILCNLFMVLLSGPLTAGEKDQKVRGMMRFSASLSNNGFLGIPLAIAVFGADSPVMPILIVLNIITIIILYTVGIYLVSGDKGSMNLKKALLNPVLIAFFFGIVLNLLDVKSLIPEVSTYTDHFSSLVTPLSMVIIGMKLGGVKMAELFASGRTYTIAAIRLILFPVLLMVIFLPLARIFGGFFDESMLLAVFIAFSMPTAGLASTFADSFGGDTKSAVAFTLGSTLLSIVTLPLLYSLLMLIL